MTENQKDSVKKSFWQRNLFLLIVLLLMALGGGGYLYQQNILTFQTPQQLNNSEEIVSELAKTQPILDNNQELQDKVDRLENLILQLAENVQNIPQSTITQPAEPRQQVVLSNDEAYELILSINQIITNIDQQQTRNKTCSKITKSIFIFSRSKI